MATGVNLATAFIDIIPTFRRGAADITRQMGIDGRQAGTRAGQEIGTAMNRGLSATSVALGGIAAAAATKVAGFVSGAVVKGFNRLSAIESAEAKLRGLGNSADDVKNIMDNALTAVRGTAFGMDEAATTAAGAVAAGIKPGKELEKVLSLVSDAATIGGSSMAEMGAIFNKVATSGKLQGDVLAQLGDRGIPIVALLSETMGKSAAEVTELASKGKIGFAEFQAAMEKGMGGAAKKSGETTAGAMKNAGAAVSRFGAALLQGSFPLIGPIFKSITGFVDKLTDAVKPLSEKFGALVQPKVTAALAAFEAGLQAVTTTVKNLFTTGASPLDTLAPTSATQTALVTLRDVFQKIAGAALALQIGVPKALAAGAENSPLMKVVSALRYGFFTVQTALIAMKIGAHEAFYRDIDENAPLVKVALALREAFFKAVDAAPGIWTTVKPIFDALKGAFVQVYEAVKPLLPQIAGLWTNLSPLSIAFRALGPVLPSIVTALAGIGAAIGDALAKSLPSVVKALGQFAGVFADSLANVIPQVAQLIVNLAPVIASLTTTVLGLVPTVLDLATNVFPLVTGAIDLASKAIGGIVQFVSDNIGFFTGFGLVILGIVAAVKAWQIAQLLFNGVMAAWRVVMIGVRVATVAWQAAQWLLNAALNANPIGIIILALIALGAGLAIAWNKSETFRNIVMAAWDGIKTAALAVWTWMRDTLWPGVKAVFEWIGGVASWLWENAIKPAWDGIKTAALAVWTWMKDTLWPGVKAVFEWIGGVASWLWENVMKPAWSGIQTAALAVWSWMRDTLWPGIKAVFDGLGVVVLWLWNNVVKPAWDGIGNIISGAWNLVIKPTFDALSNFVTVTIPNAFNTVRDTVTQRWNTLKTNLSTAWNWIKSNVFDPIATFVTVTIPNAFTTVRDNATQRWNTLKDNLSAGWTWIKTNVFDPISNFIMVTLPNAFQSGKNAIGTMWNGVKSIVSAPIEFVVTNVMKPLANGINAILDFVGVTKRVSVPSIGAIAAPASNHGGLQMATGGIVPGVRSVGRDNQRYVNLVNGHTIDLASDEGVLHQYGVDALGGSRAFEAFNAVARDRGPLAGKQFLHELMHGSGPGFARGGSLTHAIGDWMPDWMVATGNAIKTGTDAVVSGAKWVGGKAWEGITWIGDKTVEAGSALYGFAKTAAEALGDPVGLLTAMVGQFLQGLPGGGTLREMLLGAPPKLARAAGDFILGKRDAAEAAAKKKAEGDAPGVTGPLPPAQGGGNPRGYMQIAAVGKGGFPDMQVTSTFRPGAITANGGYASYHSLGRAVDFAAPMTAAGKARMAAMFRWWDQNYQPSELLYSPMGAMQLNRGHRRGNTAGATYAMHFNHLHVGFDRGGNLRFPQAHVKSDRYGQKMAVFDNGGFMQPNMPGLNLTTKPEPVFTSGQWDILKGNLRAGVAAEVDYDRFAEAMLRALLTAPTTTNIEINNPSGVTAIEAIDQAMDRLRNGGELYV